MPNNLSSDVKTQQGSIVCVGLGMTLGSHITPLSRSYIEQADLVFVGASHHLVELWVREMNDNVQSLQVYYAEGKDRRKSYAEMVEAMMSQVRKGKQVVGAFYGHPGVFALPPHKVIQQAKKEGFKAHMEPGVSAEACLYADIGVDPGKVGCQHYEASQFMFYQRNFDCSAGLVLWQIGLAGDQSMSQFYTDHHYRQILVDMLLKHYPDEHKVAIYEAAVLPVHQARVEWIKLSQFATANVSQHTTLWIPPSIKPIKNHTIYQKLSLLSKKNKIAF